MAEKRLGLERLAFEMRTIRQANGITQTELAKLTGMQRTSISRMETGQKMPTFDTIFRICEALNCRIAIVLDVHKIYNKKQIKNGNIERELFPDSDEL